MSVDIINSGDLPLNVTGVGITWTGNDRLTRIRWNGSTVWDPPGSVSGPSFYLPISRTVAPGSSRNLEFEFWGSDFSGSAFVTVDGDC